jgi:putative endonuclease
MHYIYILQSLKDTNLYIGCTNDIKKRFAQHQKGEVRSTKARLPLKLIYTEKYDDVYEAFRTERFYKTAKGKKELKEKMHCPIV